MNVTKDPVINEIKFEPSQFLIRYVENNLFEDSLEWNITMLEYMTLLSSAMIERIKALQEYSEDLVEFSFASHYNLWKNIDETDLSNIHDARNKVTYIHSKINDFNNNQKDFSEP